MWNEIKDFWKSFSADHVDLLRNISLALFGAIGRLANDHNKYDGVNLQFFYELFRGFVLAIVAVILVDAVVSYFCVVGIAGSASAVAAGFYALEITGLIKDVIPKIKDKIVSRVVK